VRVLFFNEGNLGTLVMGQGQLAEALRTGLPFADGVEARFAGLTPMGRLARAAATRPIEPLAAAGLDLRSLRWHAVQALRARRALGAELRAWPADVVHVHSHSVALALVGTMRSLPVALSVDSTVRDWWAMPAWRSLRRRDAIAIWPSCALERRALRAAALTLAWTAWSRRGVERASPGANVVEHHPGIDLERYRPAPRRPRARPRVLFIGGRFAEKGGEDLLAALEDGLGVEVDLDLVTPATIRQRPGVRVHRLGPSDPALLDLLQQADLLCLPTHGDAVPWAVLEAMACGTPVLSTTVGGIPDLLGVGEAGTVVACGDRRALRQALSALLGDEGTRARLGTAARERCERLYDARLQVPRLIEHLAEAAQAGWPRRSTSRRSSSSSARSPNRKAG
jgi:starch synthase